MSWPRTIQCGNGQLKVEKMIEFHRDAPFEDLALFYKTNGYLYIKQYYKPQGLDAIFSKKLQTTQQLLDEQDWIQKTRELDILEHVKIQRLVSRIMKLDAYPMKFKWLRCVKKGLFTGLHCDRVYFTKIPQKIITCWMPLSYIPTERGSLVVSPKSHVNRAWKTIRGTYSQGSCGSDGTVSGWLASDPNSIQVNAKWASSDFAPGDVVLLDLDLFHMTAMNVTDHDRLSCDVRWIGLN